VPGKWQGPILLREDPERKEVLETLVEERQAGLLRENR